MSQQEQQELVPEPHHQQPETEEDIYAPQYPYAWSGNINAEGVPRDEPPSSYDYAAGYQAQDAYSGSTPEASAPNEYSQQQQQQQLIPPYQYNPYDGDAYQQNNNTYGQNAMGQGQMGQQVPSYARPQQQQHGSFGFGRILFVLILISIMSSTLGHGFFFFDMGHVFGWFFGMLFFPLFILMMIFGSMRRGGRRRGPWGW